MQVRTIDTVALALGLSAFSILPACDASAAAARGFHRPIGARAGFGGFDGGFARFRPGASRFVGGRGLPPVSGVIHEGATGRPYFSAYSAYGHTGTAARFGGFARGGVPGLPGGYDGRYDHAARGRLAAGSRYGAVRRFGAFDGRRRFAVGRGFAGGFPGGYGGGFYGDAGVYGQPGVYGGQGTYGQPGTYGGQGTYGGGTTATQVVYGGGAYRSEVPLAVRFAEPPLGPSPYAPYSPGDRYAYAAEADAGPGPRVVNPYRPGPAGCACAPRGGPVIYRYGIGTAY